MDARVVRLRALAAPRERQFDLEARIGFRRLDGAQFPAVATYDAAADAQAQRGAGALRGAGERVGAAARPAVADLYQRVLRQVSRLA